MTSHSSSTKPVISRWHCYLLLASAVLTYLLIVMGGVVCVTGSGGGCPDWPGCYGSIIPPMQTASIIEFLHRLVAGLAFVLIIAAAIVSWRKSALIRWVSWPSMLAVVLVLVVSAFGAAAVLHGLPPGLAAVDLGSALIVLALVLTATVVAFAYRADPSLAGGLSGRHAFARLTFWTLGAIYLVLVSGVLVAGKGSLTRCLGWPMWRAVGGGLTGLAPDSTAPACSPGKPLNLRCGRAGLAYTASAQGHSGCCNCCWALVPGRNDARRADAGGQCDDFYVGHLCSNGSRAVGYDGGSRSDGRVGIGLLPQ